MNRDNQFHNDASQSERQAILRNERKRQEEASTLFEQAKISEALDSERSKSAVSGTKPVVDYPAIPSGPWSSGWAQPPPEPALGYSVNDLEPAGEVAEVQRSLDELAASSPAPPSVSLGVETNDAAKPMQATDGPKAATDRPMRRLR